MSTDTVVQSDPLKHTAILVRQVLASARCVGLPVRPKLNLPYGLRRASSMVVTRSPVVASRIRSRIRSRSRVGRAAPCLRISNATPPLMIQDLFASRSAAPIAVSFAFLKCVARLRRLSLAANVLLPIGIAFRGPSRPSRSCGEQIAGTGNHYPTRRCVCARVAPAPVGPNATRSLPHSAGSRSGAAL